VLIARDNDTRRALNQLARQHQRDTGQLGPDVDYGPITLAVGDRVICRNNDRDLDVDNGTRGTVRHTSPSVITLETDAHTIRELPAGCVAAHVQQAYALTGHGMQGATVEHATVVASPHDLTQGWSRARASTRLLIHGSERLAEDAPAAPRARTDDATTLARVTRHPVRLGRVPQTHDTFDGPRSPPLSTWSTVRPVDAPP